VSMMSYWTFSDVFEEQGVIKTPFYGGYGLIAEGGVPKAAFNAFAMLHRLGDRRSQPDLANALVTKREDGTLAIAVWNYAAPGTVGTAEKIHITVDGFSGTPRYHVEIVDPDHGSALAAWKAMGSPASPTGQQYEQLKSAAAGTQKLDGASTFLLPSQGLALVEVRSR
jgi:xylan 1,4-beta-xylosidase